MRVMSRRSAARVAFAMLVLPVSGSLSAQQQNSPDPTIIVTGKSAGPEIKGVISARHGDKLKVTGTDTTSTIITVDETTRIKGRGGLFSASSKLAENALLNGLPVTVKTWLPAGGMEDHTLIASQISVRNSDLRTAMMIRNATNQRFEEQTAATESLRGRLGDIDKYNIKSTTSVHFDTGKSVLSEEDKGHLCTAASTAQSTDNALLLVVGYTDSTGPEEVNQVLSEKRASRVINYLQQACGWKPYRMLTPTGMATADPAASNDTEEGKAMNRRVAVNVLVSKSVDGM